MGYWGKNDPLREDFDNFLPKGFTTSQNHVLCANFVKFGRPEIGCIIYLTKKIGPRSHSRVCADRAQNVSGPAPDSILGVPQIPSKSVHFRRSYSRTPERRSNRHKVFPILGEASVSSPSKYLISHKCTKRSA